MAASGSSEHIGAPSTRDAAAWTAEMVTLAPAAARESMSSPM